MPKDRFVMIHLFIVYNSSVISHILCLHASLNIPPYRKTIVLTTLIVNPSAYYLVKKMLTLRFHFFFFFFSLK